MKGKYHTINLKRIILLNIANGKAKAAQISRGKHGYKS
jgi:hypothetical protein